MLKRFVAVYCVSLCVRLSAW